MASWRDPARIRYISDRARRFRHRRVSVAEYRCVLSLGNLQHHRLSAALLRDVRFNLLAGLRCRHTHDIVLGRVVSGRTTEDLLSDLLFVDLDPRFCKRPFANVGEELPDPPRLLNGTAPEDALQQGAPLPDDTGPQ